MWSWKTYNNGFTLLEVLVATFVVGIVVIAAGTFFSYFFRNYQFTFTQGNTLSEARLATTQFVKEAREIQTSDDGTYPLVAANDQEIIFFADSDDDGQVERLRYFLDGSVLRRGIIQPGTLPDLYDDNPEVVTDISNYIVNDALPIFYYYNGDWPGDEVANPLAQNQRLLNTRLVQLQLLINTNPNLQDNLEVSTQVNLRNLKTNY